MFGDGFEVANQGGAVGLFLRKVGGAGRCLRDRHRWRRSQADAFRSRQGSFCQSRKVGAAHTATSLKPLGCAGWEDGPGSRRSSRSLRRALWSWDLLLPVEHSSWWRSRCARSLRHRGGQRPCGSPGGSEATARSRATRSTEPVSWRSRLPKSALGCVLFGGVDGLFEGDEVEALLAEMHEDQITVACEAMLKRLTLRGSCRSCGRGGGRPPGSCLRLRRRCPACGGRGCRRGVCGERRAWKMPRRLHSLLLRWLLLRRRWADYA